MQAIQDKIHDVRNYAIREFHADEFKINEYVKQVIITAFIKALQECENEYPGVLDGLLEQLSSYQDEDPVTFLSTLSYPEQTKTFIEEKTLIYIDEVQK